MATIREIFLVLALLLVIAGATMRSWVLSEQEKEQQMLQQQQKQFDTKITEADKVLGRELNIKPFSADDSQQNLQEELARCREKGAETSDIRTGYIICLAVGSTISACWLISLMTYCVSAGLKRLKKFLAHLSKHLKETRNKLKALLKEVRKTLRKHTFNVLDKSKQILLAVLLRLKKFLVNIFRHFTEAGKHLIETCVKKVRNLQKQYLNKPDKPKKNFSAKNALHSDYLDKECKKFEALYCDEKSLKPESQAAFETGSADLDAKLIDQLEQNIRETILPDTMKGRNLPQVQQNLEKQVAEVRQMAQTIKEASAMNSEPVKNSLDELSSQVSAIREYVSLQHNRIEKLQEGYDWNIVRTFCLRVIRCIDNLENRIATLSGQDIDTTDLEEIMDELVFALESSGVEQFRPEVNSDYNGKEKIAEVVKDKAHLDDPNMKGKIAEVVKPGYQYIIDDANVKVVRAARVKLFS